MFRATHSDGPLAGAENDVSMVAPYVPPRIWYAPAPQGITAMTPAGYMLVGWETRPSPAWPGQIEYVLDFNQSELYAHHTYEGMEEGTAVYVLAGDE